MCPNNYKQLLAGSIILGSIIFFSNHLPLYAQGLPDKADDSSDETLDITIPSPSFSGQGLGEDDTSITAGDIMEEVKGNNDIPFELPFP
ncbi:MAG TPA: hypothetical protein VFY68_07790 [Nitrososphaeraceae archaeon]|nr:hypothetical protein [Nitrososphaeraceae archaeon]